MKNNFYSLLILLFSPLLLLAESDTTNTPINRQVFHDNIKAQQLRADRADGKQDGLIRVSALEDVNLQVSDALIRRVNIMRNNIEKDTSLSTNQLKIRYLRYLEDVLKGYITGWKTHKLNPAQAPVLIDNFQKAMKIQQQGGNIAMLINQTPYEVGVIITEIFKENPGYEESKRYLYLKYCSLDPSKILSSISPYAAEPFADSLVLVAFQNSPISVYNYAQNAGSIQARLIRRNPDNRIKTVTQLSTQQNALFYYPFLDNLISGKQNIEEIHKLVGDGEKKYDSVGYYKLLVKTQIEYYMRAVRGDTPIAMQGPNGLTERLQSKAIQHFITPINELHESPAAIRFRAIEPLNAEELYYMMVMGENDIYTSSYKGSFDRMMTKMGKKPKGDSLLMLVNFDHFKKFIKMAAGYNCLDTFLRTMNSSTSSALMQAFVAKLEETKTLEDAVDVADSYGSIRNKTLQQSILKYVSDNEKRSIQNNNQRGIKIYSLLKTIFLSADSTKHIDLSKELGIPPIYTVDYNYLADDSGRIIQQVFFYGDKDGKESFASYMTSFPRTEWKVTQTKEWMEIKSLKGKPIWIYANLPLDNETDKDADAQKDLIDYLDAKGLRPVIVTHRGHSYHLQYTIEQLPESAKIIMLGSCGGYKNLSQILEFAPEAHIISTKQIGSRDVNKPIIDAINTTLRNGKNIDWRQMWGGLEASFAKGPRDKKELFEDYIPPHKNLGALFIKVYNKMEK